MNENNSIKWSIEKCNSECKVIPLYDAHDEDLVDVMDGGIGLYFDIDFLKFFYFIPVALILVVIYPVIYILLFWSRLKTGLAKTYYSVFSKRGH